MLKRDFIMVQIEELGKVIAQIIFNRNSNDGARKNPELIQSVYTFLKLDNDFLLNTLSTVSALIWTVMIRAASNAWSWRARPCWKKVSFCRRRKVKNSGQERKSYLELYPNATTLRSRWNEWRCWKR